MYVALGIVLGAVGVSFWISRQLERIRDQKGGD
ncbi:membrane protein [Gordonia phage Button]|nr:membrane protein [Gordonia phage Button]WKW84859.1 hypothetical protein SEA_JAMZY_68 [Gordonia phage Jamzy]